jgi:undecaprenyl-diphosphatase
MKEDTEINIIKYLQQLPSKYKNIVTKLMRLISSLFHCKLYIIIVLFLYLIEKINTFQVFILFSSQFIIFTIKYIIKRERPFIVDKDIKLLELMNFDTYSFPSGHTLNAFLLSYILQKNIGINLSFLPYLVGLSRMYLGVHYPTDIVGSLILSKIILHLHNF